MFVYKCGSVSWRCLFCRNIFRHLKEVEHKEELKEEVEEEKTEEEVKVKVLQSHLSEQKNLESNSTWKYCTCQGRITRASIITTR